MKKQQKQFVIMIVLLFLLLAGYWGAVKYNEVQSNKVEEDTILLLTDVKKEDVTELSYMYDGTTCHLVKEEDTWKSADDRELTLNQTRILNMLSKAVGIEVISQIENVTKTEDYGFSEPNNIITFTANGNIYKITVGDKNAVTSYYYVTLDDSDIIYLVEDTSVTGFNYSLEDLIEESQTTEESTTEEGAIDENIN